MEIDITYALRRPETCNGFVRLIGDIEKGIVPRGSVERRHADLQKLVSYFLIPLVALQAIRELLC